jgi:hypothetical protein
MKEMLEEGGILNSGIEPKIIVSGMKDDGHAIVEWPEQFIGLGGQQGA